MESSLKSALHACPLFESSHQDRVFQSNGAYKDGYMCDLCHQSGEKTTSWSCHAHGFDLCINCMSSSKVPDPNLTKKFEAMTLKSTSQTKGINNIIEGMGNYNSKIDKTALDEAFSDLVKNEIGPYEEGSEGFWTPFKLKAVGEFFQQVMEEILNTEYESEDFKELNNYIYCVLKLYDKSKEFRAKFETVKAKVGIQKFEQRCPVTSTQCPDEIIQQVDQIGKNVLAKSQEHSNADFKNILKQEDQDDFADLEPSELVDKMLDYCNKYIFEDFGKQLKSIQKALLKKNLNIRLEGPNMKRKLLLRQKIIENQNSKEGTFKVLTLQEQHLVV